MIELGEHKGDGIRYAMHLSAPKGGSAQMLRDPDGGWVSWEDYSRLKAEVERLRKAGDGMEEVIWLQGCVSGMEIKERAVKAWEQAKEGKV